MATETSPLGRVTEVKLLLEQGLGLVQEYGEDRLLQGVHNDLLRAYGRVCGSQAEIRKRDRKAD